ncbi:MAG: hypothetical protein HYV39_00440 [Candidatus Levybacteria bacterium]|nr:hypothetical protein [Candidatus Levybacteria bacterium]
MDTFSNLANALLKSLEKTQTHGNHKKIVVDPLVSKVASWYEKLRNAMDYREEEVILRAAIERILKRRIILGGDGKKVAEPLVRELVWARYFADESLSELVIGQIAEKVDLYLRFRNAIIDKKILKEQEANEWMYHLLSSDIEYLLNPQTERELVCNFMYQVMRNNVSITDDSEQNKDVQVFIAVRKAFSKDDLAFLRFHLFTQFFGVMSEEHLDKIIEAFQSGLEEIQAQLSYPRKDRIYTYVKSKTGVFLILDDLLDIYKEGIKQLYLKKEDFNKAVFDICEARYSTISGKVRRAIVRSVLFILLTKVFFAFAVEGTFESLVYGSVSWKSIFLNTGIPPLLMVFASFFLRPPKHDNSKRILGFIKVLLSEQEAKVGNPLIIKKISDKRPFLDAIFTILWLLTYLLSFGGLVYVLSLLNFNPISQGVFLFFVAIVSFLTYRINLMSREYTVEAKQGMFWPIFDFFFMPIVRVGRHLTEGIAQINILLFIFDFIIETPFKGIFGFFEQWFFFLHAKREEL